jgi:hypothetical protein
MIIRVPPKFAGGTNIANYLVDLFVWMKDLNTGLMKLNFSDNFQAYHTESLDIASGATIQITNPLPFVPQSRLIVKQVGNGLVTDGAWDRQVLEMINNGPDPVTVSIIFFR